MDEEGERAVRKYLFQRGHCGDIEERFPEPIGPNEQDAARLCEIGHGGGNITRRPTGAAWRRLSSPWGDGALAQSHSQSGEHPEERHLAHGVEVGIERCVEDERKEPRREP